MGVFWEIEFISMSGFINSISTIFVQRSVGRSNSNSNSKTEWTIYFGLWNHAEIIHIGKIQTKECGIRSQRISVSTIVNWPKCLQKYCQMRLNFKHFYLTGPIVRLFITEIFPTNRNVGPSAPRWKIFVVISKKLAKLWLQTNVHKMSQCDPRPPWQKDELASLERYADLSFTGPCGSHDT